MTSGTRLLGSVAVSILSAVALQAQVDRYELGHRFRALEVVAARAADPAARRGVREPLEAALASFFQFDFRTVSREIDRARLRLLHGDEVPAAVRVATPWFVEPETILVDTAAGTLGCRVDALYSWDDAVRAAESPSIVVSLDGQECLRTDAVDSLPFSFDVPLPRVEGDVDQVLSWRVGGVEPVRSWTVSRVANARDRIEAAHARVRALPASLERDSAQAVLNVLRALARPRRLETDFPAARLLAEVEELLEVLSENENAEFYGWRRPGEFWLRVPGGASRRRYTCRVLVPRWTDDAAAPPLLLALHGAGGSENLFFEGGGAQAPAGARARGWLLVAPKITPARSIDVADLLDGLAARYRFDPKRVYVVGHSMGAMQAIGGACRAPDRVTAVAALGGGGRVEASERLARVPFWFGIGSTDFLLEQAASSRRALEAAGVEVTWRRYDEVGHVLILQDAVPDVFTFFDGVDRSLDAEERQQDR